MQRYSVDISSFLSWDSWGANWLYLDRLLIGHLRCHIIDPIEQEKYFLLRLIQIHWTHSHYHCWHSILLISRSFACRSNLIDYLRFSFVFRLHLFYLQAFKARTYTHCYYFTTTSSYIYRQACLSCQLFYSQILQSLACAWARSPNHEMYQLVEVISESLPSWNQVSGHPFLIFESLLTRSS